MTVRFSVTGKGISIPGTGTVSVRDNAGASCTGTVTAGSCTLTFTSAGTRTLVASYAGNTTALASASTGFNLLVVEAPGVVTVTLPSGVAGIPYAMLMIADGGAPPGGIVPQYSYSATGLPPGFSFSKTGLLSGTASAGGTYTITVTATDALGQPSTPRHYTLKILDQLAVATTSLPDGLVNKIWLFGNSCGTKVFKKQSVEQPVRKNHGSLHTPTDRATP